MGHSIRALLKEQPVGQQKLVVFNASVTLNYLLLDLFEINNLARHEERGLNSVHDAFSQAACLGRCSRSTSLKYHTQSNTINLP